MRESLRGLLLGVLFFALILGGPSLAFADDGKNDGDGQTQSDPRDRNRNGKLDWHEKGWFGNNDCKKATTIRDAGATVALGSAAGGFGPGIVVGGMIGVWGQFMVWSAC